MLRRLLAPSLPLPRLDGDLTKGRDGDRALEAKLKQLDGRFVSANVAVKAVVAKYDKALCSYKGRDAVKVAMRNQCGRWNGFAAKLRTHRVVK